MVRRLSKRLMFRQIKEVLKRWTFIKINLLSAFLFVEVYALTCTIVETELTDLLCIQIPPLIGREFKSIFLAFAKKHRLRQ